MADLFTFTVKSQPEVREDFLRTVKVMLIARGIPNPNVTPESDYYVLGQAVANEIAVASANCVLKADEMMVDTALDGEGEDEKGLTRIAKAVGGEGFGLRPAGGSVGFVINDVSAASPIVTGALLTDASGLTYEVAIGGTYADEALVPIRAVDTGTATNLAEGTSLQWQLAPPSSAPNVVVSTGGLRNGADSETQEELRQRIYARLQTPSGNGNWQQCIDASEAADPRVQKGYCYPALQGAGTTHLAVTASPTATNKSRVLDPTILASTVVPYVAGQIPRPVYLVTTSVVDQIADVAFGLLLPEAPTASPPGAGGGWVDGTPWPAPNGTTTFKCEVVSVTSTTVMVVDALSAPTPGVTHIMWLSKVDWSLKSAIVLAVSGTAGAYQITLDTPLVGITASSYIWPACVNAQAYVDAVLAAFQLMGPGEKTSNAAVLARGYRHPRPAVAYAYSLGTHLTRAVAAIAEVDATQFLYRYDGNVTVLTGPGGSPPVPYVHVDPVQPPRIFVPRNIAFYRLP